MKLDNIAIAARNADIRRKVSGSDGLTPKRKAVINLVRARAPTTPRTIPASASVAALVIIILNT